MEDSLAQKMKLLNRRTRPLLYAGILALTYFVTGKLAASILGLVKAEASPVWPPAGIALAALLLQGRRMWPGIALGSVLLNLSAGIPSAVIVTSAFSVTLQALAGEALLTRSGFSTKLASIARCSGFGGGRCHRVYFPRLYPRQLGRVHFWLGSVEQFFSELVDYVARRRDGNFDCDASAADFEPRR
jgi:hypothetical protein